jgi:small subunit ribosomal protein S20
MPHTKSVAKNIRQSEARRARNKPQKSKVRTAIKKTVTAIAEGKKDELPALIKAAASTVDKAATKGILHRNTASRIRSRLTKGANKVG